tara:strand:+ start:52 stop:306 length:255 start_codon:yes stop_codon:yes gene_type:complete
MYNIKFLETLVKEAFDAFGRGDKENGTALLNSFFDKMHPELVKDAMSDKRLILELILASSSKDKVEAFSATAMLNYLKEKGVEM